MFWLLDNMYVSFLHLTDTAKTNITSNQIVPS